MTRDNDFEMQLKEYLVAIDEGRITTAQVELLSELLEEHADARKMYLEHMGLLGHLAVTAKRSELFEGSAKLIQLEERKQRFAIQNWNLILYVTCCVCLVLGGLFFTYLTTPVAHVFPEPNSHWVDGNITTEETLLSGSRRHLLRGAIEIRFTSGSIVNLKAPAQFTINGSNEIFLQAGKLVAEIPESGHGFTVDTQMGQIVDLGTSFSVNVGAELNTEIKVYRGKVQVAGSGGAEPPREILANEAVLIDSVTKSIQSRNYTSSDFIPLIARDHAVDRFSENIVFQEKLPEAVAAGDYNTFEHDNLAFLFPEKQNVLLTEDLKIEIGQPGIYQVSADLLKGKSTIPAGTTVDCFRVYYKPVVYSDKGVKVEGEILFDRPILGAIIVHKELAETNRLFHPSVKDVPDENALPSPGIEIGTDEDELTISKDRKTLTFKLGTGGKATDEFRVILKSRKNGDQ